MNKGKFTSLCLAITLVFTPVSSLSHGGRTDSSGGHRDNKNKSGLGGYHYHHGAGPHLHKNGVCPYSAKNVNNTSKSNSSKVQANKSIQKKLNELGYDSGKVDGILGDKSKKAIKDFQKNKGLVADGIAGSKTKAALGI